MKRPTKHLIPGLAAMAILGAGPAVAVAAPPDLFPFIDDGGVSPNAIQNWYVDTAVNGGTYSAHYQHATQVGNLATAGAFQIGPGTPASGGPDSRVAPATQSTDGGTVFNALPAGVFLSSAHTGPGPSDYDWGVEGVVRYTLTPNGGTAIVSSLTRNCFVDADNAFGGGTTPVFTSATCRNRDQNATGFASGISPGWEDVNPPAEGGPFFDITGVGPGDGVVTAVVNPSGAITETPTTGGANNTASKTVAIPGVVATATTAAAGTGVPANINLAATIIHPEVKGRRLTGGTPPAAAAATGAKTFAIASNPAHGTATVNAATGVATYTATGGYIGPDSFTFYAEDSRGLRSAPATVSVTVSAKPPAPSPGGPGPTYGPGKLVPGPISLTVARLASKGSVARLGVSGSFKPPKGAGTGACSGRMLVTAKAKKHTLASRKVAVRKKGAECRWSATLSLKPSVLKGIRSVAIQARFLGTGSVAPRSSKSRVVKIR